MQVIKVPHTPDPERPLRGSVFLAGPCPRDSGAADWRTQCCEIFAARGFDGALFWPVPEDNAIKKDVHAPFNLDAQVQWETDQLRRADVILFWVPRSADVPAGAEPGQLPPMLGMTTNVEAGLYFSSMKSVLGFPENAIRMRYLQWWYDKVGSAHRVVHTLEEAVDNCLKMLASWGYKPQSASAPLSPLDPVARLHGEQFVPLILWRAACFQSWYQQLRQHGNEIVWAHADWVMQIGAAKTPVAFLAVLNVHIKIAAESGRIKSNEVVIFRPDTAVVVAYHAPSKKRMDAQLMLTKEFRSPARNALGVVCEPAAGSSWELVAHDGGVSKEQRAAQISHMAHEELEEETGLSGVAPDRLRFVCARQVAATLSAHHAHVFACRLSEEEFARCKKAAEEKQVFGVEEDSERTELAIVSFRDLLAGSGAGAGVDWGNVGMISQVLMSDEGLE